MSAVVDLQRLTLVFPPNLEDRLVELLLEQEPPLPGFTIVAGEGHGADFASASLREQVRGRIAQRVVLMVLPAERIERLIAALRVSLPHPHVIWWAEPVLAFGRLA